MRRKFPWRLLLWVAIILLPLVSLLIAIPFFTNLTQYRDVIATKVSETIGRTVQIRGDISVAFFPTPRVSVGKVSIASSKGASASELLSVEKVVAKIHFWPLFSRQIHIGSVILSRPNISLEQLANGSNNWTFTLPASSDAESTPSFKVALDELEINDGGLSYRSSNQHYQASQLNLVINMASFSGPYKIAGGFFLQGHTFKFNADISGTRDPIAYLVAIKVDKNELKIRGNFSSSRGTASGAISFKGNPNAVSTLKANLKVPSFLVKEVRFDSEFKASFQGLVLKNADLEIGTGHILFDADVDWQKQLRLTTTIRKMPGQGHLTFNSVQHGETYDGSVKLGVVDLAALLKWLQIKADSLPAALGKSLEVSTTFSYNKALRLENFSVVSQNARLVGGLSWHQGDGIHHLTTNLKSPSLENLLKIFAVDLPSKVLAGPIVFGGEITAAAQQFSIRRMTASFGSGLAIKGDLSADFSKPKTRITATIYTTPLNTAQFMEGFPNSSESGPRWSKNPINLNFLKKFEGRFEISTAQVTRNDLSINNVKIIAQLQNETLSISSLSGGVFGGSLNISGSVSSDGAMTLKSSLNDAVIKNIISQSSALKIVDGRLSFSTNLTTQGKSVAELVNHLNGKFGFSSRAGSISGFDLDSISQRVDNLGDAASIAAIIQTAMAKGKTSFTNFNGEITFNQGVGTIHSMTMVGTRARGSASGTIDLPQFTMNVLASLEITNPPNLPVFGVRFKGPIDNPSRELDTATLITYLIKNVAKAIINQVTKGPLPSMQDLFK